MTATGNDQASLLVLGAGGHGRVVASTARAAGWQSIGFVDPRWPELRDAGGWSVVGADARSVGPGIAVIVGIGDNRRRMALLDELAAMGLPLATIIHPTAWLCPSVSVGNSSVVMAGAAANNGARIGRGVIVNTGAVVEHDCVLEDGVHVSPGAVLAGTVLVGAGAWIGAGATVRQGIRIGAGAIVGIGAAVVCDIPPGETWVGVPAQPIRRTTAPSGT